LHRKVILRCREEGVRRRPVRGSTNGRVEGRPDGGANGGAYGDANESCSGPRANGARGSAYGGANGDGRVQGSSGAHDGANRGTRAGYEEEKVGRRVASVSARGNACGCTNGGCSGQGADGGGGTRDGGGTSGDACEGARDYNGTHDALSVGGGGQSDHVNGTRWARPRETGRGSAHADG
jgi:hypothetical protein